VGLSDIPLIGDLLTSKNTEKQESEILISITPRLVRGPQLSEDDLVPLYVGSKENIRVPSARPPLFGPPEAEEEAAPAAPAPGAAPAPPNGGAPSAVAPGAGVPAPVPSPQAPAPVPAAPGAQPQALVTPLQQPGVPGPVRASVTPLRPRMAVGETKNLDVVVSTPVKATAVEVVLVYDAKVLEAQGVDAGSLLTLDGVSVDAERSMEPGRVKARFHRASAASGSGVVATFGFKALAPGASPVSIESVKVTTESGEQVAQAAGVARVVVGPAEAQKEVNP
jgi:general secretion pathway protein D